jgi:hypothetical protein
LGHFRAFYRFCSRPCANIRAVVVHSQRLPRHRHCPRFASVA